MYARATATACGARERRPSWRTAWSEQYSAVSRRACVYRCGRSACPRLPAFSSPLAWETEGSKVWASRLAHVCLPSCLSG
eukprot:366252-Chlamydomonas_euryale.AAC.2